jgi:GT2 family glycosyltransferase
MSPSSASIVIPTYQRCAALQRALTALARQTVPGDRYEVLVCVDGSDDGTRQMAASFPAPCEIRTLWQEHRGRATAANAGIRAARGDLLILLDDDMEPDPGFLAAHLRAHAGSPRIGVLGAVPIVIDRAAPPVLRYVGAKFNGHLETLARPGYRLLLTDFYTGNFSIARETLIEVGEFDEDFTLYGNEDLELFVRLRRAGVRIVYDPQARARQYYSKDFRALARDTRDKGHTAVLLARKHADTVLDLRLAAYRRGPLAWRAARALLIRASRRGRAIPDHVVRMVGWLEWSRLPGLRLGYKAALDYFYWLGATSALDGTR